MMELIKVQIKGFDKNIEDFIKKFTRKKTNILVFNFTRIPCIGEIIEICDPDFNTLNFRVVAVLHSTFCSYYKTWGCITVEPCSLVFNFSQEINKNNISDDEPPIDSDDDDDGEPPIDSDDDDDGEPPIDSDDDDDGEPPIDSDDDELYQNRNSLNQKRNFHGRSPHGSLTPEEDYRLPILRALSQTGRSRTKSVLKLVGEIMREDLKEIDYRKYNRGNEMRWQKRAKWVRYTLLHEGLVKATPRGIWEISEEGRIYLERHQ